MWNNKGNKEAQEFVGLAQECNAISYGDFKLKSGRISPYFMDVGKVATVAAAVRLGEMYANMAETLEPSASATLLGLPYKGIPLAAVACAELGRREEGRFSYAFLRKEKKDHGEKGLLVGEVKRDTSLWLVDDVLTAGTAVLEALEALKTLESLLDIELKIKGLLVAFDRMERANEKDRRHTSRMLLEDHDLKVHAIATAHDLIDQAEDAYSRKIRNHLEEFGVAAA